MTITILIADDHDIIREGIKNILRTQPIYKVVGEAVNGQEVLERLEKLKPDIVIVNFGANDGYSVPNDVYDDMEIVGNSSTWVVYIRSQLEKLRLVSIIQPVISKFQNRKSKDAQYAKGKGYKCRVRPGAFEENIKTISSMSKDLGAPAIFLNISIANQYLDVLKKLSDSEKIIFIDVETPLQNYYYSDDRENFLSKFPQKQIKTPIIPEIDEMCSKLLGEKQMKIRRDRTLFTDDFHPNAPGNYIIAKSVLKKLENLKLIQ